MHEKIMNTSMDKMQETVMTLPFAKLMHALETAAKLSLGEEHSLTTGLGLMKSRAAVNETEEESTEALWDYVSNEITKLTGDMRKKFIMYLMISINAVGLMHEHSN